MKNRRRIAAAALTLAAFSAPGWAQNMSMQPMASGSTMTMSGDNYFTRMTGAQKFSYAWISNNLDAREIRRFHAQGFRDTDIRGAAHIALVTSVPLTYVLERLKVTGEPIQLLANELGVPKIDLTRDIPGYGMNPTEYSMAMTGVPMPKM